jgi:hypothetical protein
MERRRGGILQRLVTKADIDPHWREMNCSKLVTMRLAF